MASAASKLPGSGARAANSRLRLIRALDRSNEMIDGNLARPRRFERPTPAFGGQYSIQLSYGREGRIG